MSKVFNRHSHDSSEGGQGAVQHSIIKPRNAWVVLVCLFTWSAAQALSHAEDDGWPDWKKSGFVAACRDPANETRIEALQRVATSEELRRSSASAKEFAPQVAELLEDPDSDVRSSAAQALGTMGEAAKAVAPQVAKLLENPDRDVRSSAASTLMVWGPFSDTDVFNRILNAAYLGEKHARRVDAYLLFGHDAQKALCISWLGDRSTGTLPKIEKFDKEEARNVINALRIALLPLENDKRAFPRLRREAGEHISALVRGQNWSAGDILWLRKISSELFAVQQSDRAQAVDAILDRIEVWRWMRIGLWVLAFHATAWLLLIILYPLVPFIQGLVFRRAWFRKFLGFGYVNLLLTVIPFFRRRLFEPFRQSMVPRGALGTFQEQTYFDDCKLIPKNPVGASPDRSVKILVPVRGQNVIEGASGLGKTTLLRHLATRNQRPSVLLRATECRDGVLPAILARLPWRARDEDFLRVLVRAGAVDILIDGLNEAPPDTRARISHFFQESFRGNFVLTTQPLVWDAPLTAEVWELQPLRVEEIEAFMRKQWPAFESNAIVSEADYQRMTKQLLTDLNERAKEGDEIAREQLGMLCNPMECVLAAELLSLRQLPRLGKMLAQFQRLMEEDFRKVHNRQFPREAFAERVFEWRQSGQPYLDVKDFESEIECLVKHKLMLERTDRIKQKDGNSRNETRWVFRHDKIMDFLLLPAFGTAHRERRFKLWADPRFAGIFDLLAEMLPLEEADELKTFLVERGAQANDNALANRFIRRLRLREVSPEGAVERQYLNAMVSLLEVARLTGKQSLRNDCASNMPPHVRSMYELAKKTLRESLEKARQLDLDRTNEIERAFQDLKDGLLTRQPIMDAEIKESKKDIPADLRFDVFLSHNSKDKPSIRQLAGELKSRGLRVWLDEWELVPGRPWQEALEEIIRTTKSAAVLVGADGFGPWETPEMRACLSQFVERKLPVIPVLLPDAPAKPALPLFLTQFTWVDLRDGSTLEGMNRLVWGITGVKPESKSAGHA